MSEKKTVICKRLRDVLGILEDLEVYMPSPIGEVGLYEVGDLPSLITIMRKSIEEIKTELKCPQGK